MRVLDGPPARMLLSHSLAINGEDSDAPPPAVDVQPGGICVSAAPDTDVGRRFPGGCFRLVASEGTVIESVGRDELLFTDAVSRGRHFLCLVTAASSALNLSIEGHLIEPAGTCDVGFWDSVAGGLSIASANSGAAERVAEIFPWFVQNALVHYLSPRGLEQFSGGGWGTRDVCQGPVELMLGLGRSGPVRDILLRVFRQQNPDGDWPQWFMFFERERGIRPGDSHGDIVYWPVLALAEYLLATGDAAVLDERVPFFHHEGPDVGENATVSAHVAREGVQHEGGGGDEAPDEASPRLVVAAQQQVHREHEHEREEEAPGGGEDERAHRVSSSGERRRSSATMPTAAIASTVISPRVSKPRKSTRITFTTLRPFASGRLVAAK